LVSQHPRAVHEVARRWQVSPQQVFGWRRQARKALEAAAAPAEPAFVPVVPEPPVAAPEPGAATAPAMGRTQQDGRQTC
jgi:transposase